MDNLGAFITLNGKDLRPNFTTFEAVVSKNKISFISMLQFQTSYKWNEYHINDNNKF